MPELVREVPEPFLALAPTERVPFTRKWLKQADGLNLSTHADRVLLLVLALSLGDEFLCLDPWRSWVDNIARKQMTLLQAIQQAATS